MDITDAAQRIGALAWCEQQLFEIVGGWVVTTPEPDTKLLFARASRHHGDHALALVGVLPDTRDHDPDSLVAPGDDDLTRLLHGVDSTDTRLRALAEVLPAQVAALEAFAAAASAVRDGPAMRVVGDVAASDRALADEVARTIR